MSFKYQDDRQVIQRAALSNSIGTAVNTTLDVVFSTIDSVMVNLNGTQTLTNKTLAFLKTNIVTDSTTTGSSATLPSGDIADGVVRLTNSSLVSVSGITAGGSSQFITIENQTGNTITINNNDSGASVGNRIYTGTGTNLVMVSNSTITLNYDSTINYWMLQGITSGTKTQPTVQTFLSGSGTYTTPVGVLYIRVKMVGGGGGGSASGTTAWGPASAGGTSTFGTSLLEAVGGLAATSNVGFGQGGQGGTASLGSGPLGIATTGNSGINGIYQSSANLNLSGGAGGAASVFGGAPLGGIVNTSGSSAPSNSGAGGGGGGIGAVANATSGGGGGSGGFIDAIITSPSPTYSYVVAIGGSGGTAGSSGFAGGNGGSGIIIVEEYYQ